MNANLQKQLKQTIDKEVNKLVTEIKKQIPQKLQLIKQEIFGSFQVIVSAEVQKVFLETYGPNYDVNALNSSLNYFMGNDLRPDFSYDKNKFIFNSTLKNNEREFNQNVKKTRYQNFIAEPDFQSIEHEDIYYDDNPLDNAFDEIYNSVDDRDVFNPHNKVLRQGGYSSLEETYEGARVKALESFNNYYIKIVKPNILRKYGIKID